MTRLCETGAPDYETADPPDTDHGAGAASGTLVSAGVRDQPATARRVYNRADYASHTPSTTGPRVNKL